jgi:hypothetical protein
MGRTIPLATSSASRFEMVIRASSRLVFLS